MDIQERHPHLPFFLALCALAVPLTVVLSDAVHVLRQADSGILLHVQNGHWLWTHWDAQLVFAALVVYAFNTASSAYLARAAYRKMLRRGWRYALYLAGVAVIPAWLFALLLGVALANDWHFLLADKTWLVCYAIAVLLLARLFLPVQLTRAPVQPIVFHKNPARKK